MDNVSIPFRLLVALVAFSSMAIGEFVGLLLLR